MTFRTTFRETRKSRQIALIVIFREKYARRILAIVSTISISNSASQTTRRPVWTLIPGVPIGCRSPRKRGPYSMPNDTIVEPTGFRIRVNRVFRSGRDGCCSALLILRGWNAHLEVTPVIGRNAKRFRPAVHMESEIEARYEVLK